MIMEIPRQIVISETEPTGQMINDHWYEIVDSFVDINIRDRVLKEDGTYDIIYPLTKASNVYMSDGITTAEEIINNHLADDITKSGGEFEGIVTAQTNTSYTIRQVRNIILSTSAPSGGNNGDIWIQYS